MTLEVVCFDLDDTLYPYAEYARAGFEAAADHLAARTGRDLSEELLALYFEEGVTERTFDHLLDRHGLPGELASGLVAAYHSSTGPLERYPETEWVLERLAGNYRLGLVTDGRNGHAKLERLGLADRFEVVLVNPALGLSKHETEPFDRALATLDARPENAVYVGDDPRVDFRAPNELGMTTLRVRRGRYADLEPRDEAEAPDEEIGRLDELPALVEGTNVARGSRVGPGRD